MELSGQLVQNGVSCLYSFLDGGTRNGKWPPNGLCNVRVNSNREHPPRANPGHLFHDESQGPGI